jgi:hypothetical protein
MSSSKKMTFKWTLGHVFSICLRPQNNIPPPPPSYMLYTCVQYRILIQIGKGGKEGDLKQKVRGTTVHKTWSKTPT